MRYGIEMYDFNDFVKKENKAEAQAILKKHDEENAIRENERQELEAEKAETKFLNDLLQIVKSEGFEGLKVDEVEAVSEILEEVLNSRTQSEEKFSLIKAVLSDEQAYKFYTLRLNARSTINQQAMLKAMNVNLSQISSKTSGVKMASMFTGMAAARHLGEEIAEDFGGED